MIDKSLRKATAERHGPVVVVHMTGGPDCLWMNMYLDCDKGQMTCDSDIGSYAYHWGNSWDGDDFITFCICWLSNEEWLLRKCTKEKRSEKAWQKRFAEICREVIVPALERLKASENTNA